MCFPHSNRLWPRSGDSLPELISVDSLLLWPLRVLVRAARLHGLLVSSSYCCAVGQESCLHASYLQYIYKATIRLKSASGRSTFHTLMCVHNPTKDSTIYVCLHAHALLQIILYYSPVSCLTHNVSLCTCTVFVTHLYSLYFYFYLFYIV